MTYRRLLPAGLVALALAQGAGAGVTLDFGVYTSDKATTMVSRFRAALDALGEKLGEKLQRPVHLQLQVAADYRLGIEALVRGEVDISRLGPASYVEARRRNAGIEVLAMESKGGAREFHGVICVHADSDIHSLTDLRGRSFAFGNERSTIGRYLSQKLLADHGIRAADLSHFEYLGRHDRVGNAVAAGRFDAGALKESTFSKLLKKGRKLRAIARMPVVTKPWVVRAGLDPEIVAALREALMEFNDSDALAALNKSGFIDGHDGYYDTIRTAIESNNAFFAAP